MEPDLKTGALILGSVLCICAAHSHVAQAQMPYYKLPQHDPWQAQIDAWKAQQDAQNAQHAQPTVWQPVQDAQTAQPTVWQAQPQIVPAQAAPPRAPVAWRAPDPLCERDPGRPGCELGWRQIPRGYPAAPQAQHSPAKVAAALALGVLALGVTYALVSGPLITPAMFAGMRW